MSNFHIELILSRQLADSLSVPAFLVNTRGDLLFFNEPAEELLGMRFEEAGSMPVGEWSTKFVPQYENGDIIPSEELGLVKTLRNQTPHHEEMWIKSVHTGELHKISVTSYPIIGRPDRFVGAMALFWKSPK